MIATQRAGLSIESLAVELKKFAHSPASLSLPQSERILMQRSPKEVAFAWQIPGGPKPSQEALQFIAKTCGVSYESLVEDNPEATRAFFKEKVREIKERKRKEESPQPPLGSTHRRTREARANHETQDIAYQKETAAGKPSTLAQRIAYARKKANLSRGELADALGCSREKIYRWESENPAVAELPLAEILPRMAEVLDVSSQWLTDDNTQLYELESRYELPIHRKSSQKNIILRGLKLSILPFIRYCEFKGRSGRAEYWAFLCINVFIVTFLKVLLEIAHEGVNQKSAIETALYTVVYLVVGIAHGVPVIALLFRRLQDTGISGWWLLSWPLAYFIPASALIFAVPMIAMGSVRGTEGPNRYGPPPSPRVPTTL